MTSVFLMTDVVGSTQLWERFGSAMPTVLARHDELLNAAVRSAGGEVFKHTGDGMIAAFDDADRAVQAAMEIGRALTDADWSPIDELLVRTSIHAGPATRRDGDFFGPALNRVARINGAAHPGQILVSDAARHLLATPKGLDLGEHRLRDLGEPIRLWQLDDGTHPPLRALRAGLHNLPVQLNEFVGRHEELTQLGELVRRHRLVSITGVGGCGKTRIALQVAAAVSDDFPGGVWFADLRAVEEPEQIYQQVAAAIGLLTGGEVERAEEMASMIAEYADRQAPLVILDNCEHLVDDAADVAEDLLHHAAGLTILATTREALGPEGERVWRIPSMSAETGDASELFLTRAMAADSNFELRPGDREIVDEITRSLDGIPLAIELAAARVAHMTLADLQARLDERFSLLSGGRRARRQRQQTLQAMMDWSWELLDDDERQMLPELAVFRGGFDQPGVDAVCTRPSTGSRFEVLSSLVDRSLVAVASHGATSRYHLLETVRLYGLDRLTARGDAVATRDRHAAWVQSFCSSATSWDFRAAENSYAIANVDNVLAALEWLSQAEKTDDVADIAAARPVLWVTDRNIDGLRWLTRDLVEHPDLSIQQRLAAYSAATNVWLMAGDYDRCAELNTEGCALVDGADLDDPATRAWAAMLHNGASMLALDHAQRSTHQRRALEIWPEAARSQPIFRVAIGVTALLDGDFDGVLDATVGISGSSDDLEAITTRGVEFMVRGMALSELGRTEEALEVANRLMASRAARETPISTGVTQMAFVHARAGQPQEALDLIRTPPQTCVGKAVDHWRYGRALLLAQLVVDDDPELAGRLVGCVRPVRTITLGFRRRQLQEALSDRLGPAFDDAVRAGGDLGEDTVVARAHDALRARGLAP